ncbi:MAG: VWA domain-containing protein [Pseudorhodobacter sp.]|nr:VWA domain-containing protein [Pseudorhodobacter sp.]
MFLPLFLALRKLGVPVSLREFLALLEGVSQGLVTYDINGFYHLARLTLVKDERHFDRFDRAFAECFAGIDSLTDAQVLNALSLPADWLTKLAERNLTPEERADLTSLGFDKLLQTLRDRLAEQDARHQGGNKWIGTAGTSPFGAFGDNPEGVRIGQDTSRHHSAVKVWDRREFRNLDGTAELGTRTLKLALRALRRWAREGAAEELDLDQTIRATAAQGWLDVQTRPERRNAVKVLLFLDIGGSMDPYVQVLENLFTAARAEFKTLHHVYFHNCLYEGVWRDNSRRAHQTPTWDLLRLYGPDYKAIFVGDAAMSPYEISHVGGANEHWNNESGHTWLTRACTHWRHHLWINPVPQDQWRYSQSTRMIETIFDGNMVPMTLDGLAKGVKTIR